MNPRIRFLLMIFLGIPFSCAACVGGFFHVSNFTSHCGFPQPTISDVIVFSQQRIDVDSAQRLVPLGAITGTRRTKAAFSPDDRFLVSLGEAYSNFGRDLGAELPSHCSVTWIVDVSGAKPSRIMVNNSGIETERVWLASNLDFNSDGNLIVLNNYQRQIIHVPTGREIARLRYEDPPGPFPPSISGFRFSPDDRWIVATTQNRLLIWNANTFDLEFGLTEPSLSDRIYSPGFSQNLISVSSDGTVRSWNLKTRTEMVLYQGGSQNVLSMDMAPNGDIAVSYAERAVVIDTTSGAVHMELPPGRLLYSPNGRFLLSRMPGEWRVWDVETQQLLGHINIEAGDDVNSITFDPTSQFMAVAFVDGLLNLYTIAGEMLSTYQVLEEEEEITDVAFNQHGTLLAISWRSEGDLLQPYDLLQMRGGVQLWGVQ